MTRSISRPVSSEQQTTSMSPCPLRTGSRKSRSRSSSCSPGSSTLRSFTACRDGRTPVTVGAQASVPARRTHDQRRRCIHIRQSRGRQDDRVNRAVPGGVPRRPYLRSRGAHRCPTSAGGIRSRRVARRRLIVVQTGRRLPLADCRLFTVEGVVAGWMVAGASVPG